jgi:hypothetical protein
MSESRGFGGLEVLGEQCQTCIFRPGNLMHLQPGRLKSMTNKVRQTQGHIPCHETMTYLDDGDAEDEDARAEGPICRGFYDAMGETSQIVRIAERLGCLRFVDLAEALARPGRVMGE